MTAPTTHPTHAARPSIGRLSIAGRWSYIALPSLLLLVLIATILGYNTPYATSIAANTQIRQALFGFHGVEQAEGDSFRWTNGNAQVCLDQIGRVPSSTLSLRVLGKGANALGNLAIDLQVDGRPITSLPIIGATRIYRVMLGDALSQHDNACVLIASRAITSPSDPRRLGVPFTSLAIQPLRGAAPIRPAALQLSLNLLLAAIGYWALRRIGLPTGWTTLLIGGVALALLAAVWVGAIPPGLGLARHMLTIVVGGSVIALSSEAYHWLRLRFPQASALRFDLLAMAFWSLVLMGLVRLIQALLGYSNVWPLKAGFYPGITPLIPLAALAFALWAWLLLRMLDPRAAEPGLGASVAALLAGASSLPALLKISTREWESLFTTFSSTSSDYISDVPQVGNDPLGFLRAFVSIKDQLSLHSSTHPPGSILFLWGVERLLGPGTVPASTVVILLSSLAALAGLWLGRRLGGPRIGLLAGAIAAVMPGQMIYSVTSMDGIFNTLLAFAAIAFLLALEPPFRARSAALAGLLISLGLFFTYATTQLAFFGAAVAALAIVRGWGATSGSHTARLRAAARPVLRQGLIAVAVIVGSYGLLFLISGFNVVEGAVRATTINAEVMRSVTSQAFLPPSFAYYTLYIVANLLAFGWYLGPWGLTAIVFAGSDAAAKRPPTSWTLLAIGSATLIAGMTLSGLFNREVERIWGFTYPLLAALAASHSLQGSDHERRWRAGLFLGLAFTHSLCIRALLNTSW
ncbi:MAG: glycosyltransferase family 39 protein [Oscillochloris sp.]|nr:glycosyltransferase family 39 protein [Oscillochloris sp.]